VDDLGDIGGVVAAPFEVLGDEQQVGAGGNRARIAHHIGQQLAEETVVVLVDLFVARPDACRLFDLADRIGVQHLLQARADQPSEALDRAGQRRQRLAL
jgi:hypothetical protein